MHHGKQLEREEYLMGVRSNVVLTALHLCYAVKAKNNWLGECGMAMRVDLLQESYAQLYELVGEELTEKIYEMYRGRQISFPMRLYNRDKVAAQIVEEYDGHNLAELTKKYEYSQRWIRQIIQKHRESMEEKK